MKFFKKISLVPKGLRYKLMIAFCLMSIIPLLVTGYLIRDYIFPPRGDVISTSWIIFFCMIIASLGLVLAKQMIEPVIEMALEAKLIAEGDFSRRIAVDAEDEVGDLGQSINQLTRRIKGNMEELKSFGERTRKINLDIHKRVLALSGLLQIGEHISSSAEMEDVMTLIAEKIVQVLDPGYAMIFLPKFQGSETLECNISANAANDKLKQLEIRIDDEPLGKVPVGNDSPVYVDSKTKGSRQMAKFREEYGAKNFAIFYIISRGKPAGMILVGNDDEGFVFKDDEIELIKVFVKQAAIACESDELVRKAKALEIKDNLTDLYNEKYIVPRLEEEIQRGVFYQRPCSYVLFKIDDFSKFREENGDLAAEKALVRIASVFKDNVTQIGRAARLSGERFSLLLPEKNKKEAYRVAEEVRKSVENMDLKLEKAAKLTVSGGVSENPLDGSTAAELMKKAESSLSQAEAQGKNRVL